MIGGNIVEHLHFTPVRFVGVVGAVSGSNEGPPPLPPPPALPERDGGWWRSTRL